MPSENASNARISPIAIKPDRKIKTLDTQEIDKIHEATQVILHKTGVRFPCQKALDIFAQAGAEADFKTEIVKIRHQIQGSYTRHLWFQVHS